MSLNWQQVDNARNPFGKAYEAESKGYILSAYDTNGYQTREWDIRLKGTNIPLAVGRTNEINTAKSHAARALKELLKTHA